MKGVLTVARLELTVRVRAGRWRWLLLGWFVVLVLFMALLSAALPASSSLNGHRGTIMYGALQLFMLALAMVVMPALTSQSVNRDREHGTLGVLQVTQLSAFDIAAGKLVAAWGAACLFLASSAPLVVWSMVEGGVPAFRVLSVSIVMVVLVGVVCGLSLGLSALLARSTTSSVLSYAAVFGLTIGTLILFGLATATTEQTVTVNEPGNGGSFTEHQTYTDETWWMLAPNPFVILADAAPVAPQKKVCYMQIPGTGPSSGTFCTYQGDTFDPLGDISRAVRDLRAPPLSQDGLLLGPQSTRAGLVWPYGLGFDLILGGFMLYVTTRRLRTPRIRLPRGVRVG
jgi:ABC-type transport system involved in multi-copper enzyme maturation permease subunit